MVSLYKLARLHWETQKYAQQIIIFSVKFRLVQTLILCLFWHAPGWQEFAKVVWIAESLR